MSDKIKARFVSARLTYDPETQVDIDAGRYHKVASIDTDLMTWAQCENYAKQQLEELEYKSHNALIGMANRWCDIMTSEAETVELLLLAEYFACLNLSQQLASDDEQSIKVGQPPRKILSSVMDFVLDAVQSNRRSEDVAAPEEMAQGWSV